MDETNEDAGENSSGLPGKYAVRHYIYKDEITITFQTFRELVWYLSSQSLVQKRYTGKILEGE